MAIVTSKQIAAGDEILVSYGAYSAAKFLYKYGWVCGGPDVANSATSSQEMATVRRYPSAPPRSSTLKTTTWNHLQQSPSLTF